jgi:hypothetical protein
MQTNLLPDVPTLNRWIAACAPVDVDAAPVRVVGPLRLPVRMDGAVLVIGRKGRR